MECKEFDPKDPEADEPFVFEFKSDLADTTIVGTPTAQVMVIEGVDAASGDLLHGAVVVDGTKGIQRLKAGVPEALYLVRVIANRSDGAVIVRGGLVRVRYAGLSGQ